MLAVLFGSRTRTNLRALLAVSLLILAGSCNLTRTGTERIAPNDNRFPAGKLREIVQTVRLEVRRGRWYPDGEGGASLILFAFAEKGKQLQNPGPLIRVQSGTIVRASVHNTLGDSLVVYGLHTRPGTEDDTIHVQPGATRDVSFEAGDPGTYFYWATTTHRSVDERNGSDSQLHGAFIIDPPGAPLPKDHDRVFVLGSWTGERNSEGISADLRVINGLSWPHTPHMTYATGDTVRWRWVNPTDSPHPMHLHGFYFDVTGRGSWAADTTAPGNTQRVVTEMPLSGGTFEMQWIPEESGNWLMHCHVAYHTSYWLSASILPMPPDPILIDHMRGMRGMVLGVTVRPGANRVARPDTSTGERTLRLVAKAAPKRFDNALDEMAFVLDGAVSNRRDSVPTPSSLLVLRRNEPVSINIVNRTRAETSVHWHGLEVPSYIDGVPGWSGSGSRLAPVIVPGDSFVASFTPTRSGTFIYHAHSNESFQISLGLYGALIVVDSAGYNPSRERLIILGSAGPGERGARINGRLEPDTLRLKAGTTYRLRLIHIVPDWTIRLALLSGDSVVHWKALAKDGAELPALAQTVRPATLIAGPGETMDFEYTPKMPGLMRLDVNQRTGEFKTHLPIRVEK